MCSFDNEHTNIPIYFNYSSSFIFLFWSLFKNIRKTSK